MDYYGSLVVGGSGDGSGGGSGGTVDIPIKTVKVNGVAQVPVNKAVDITVPTKASDLEDDMCIELTRAEYDALSQDEKLNGVSYFCTDTGEHFKNGVLYSSGGGGEKGEAGFSPIIEESSSNTEESYRLDITTEDGSFTTPNLKGTKGEQGIQGEKGETGETGEKGEAGTTYTPSIGLVTTVDSSEGADVSVDINEESKQAVLNFSIPKGGRRC